jgi:hypothetical protein
MRDTARGNVVYKGIGSRTRKCVKVVMLSFCIEASKVYHIFHKDLIGHRMTAWATCWPYAPYIYAWYASVKSFWRKFVSVVAIWIRIETNSSWWFCRYELSAKVAASKAGCRGMCPRYNGCHNHDCYDILAIMTDLFASA